MIYVLIAAAAVSAIWFLLNRYYVRPLKRIQCGMDLLREQDFASRLRKVGQPETDKVVELFNDMMERLRLERLRLREQDAFMNLLVHESSMGVVLLDHDGITIRQANPAARAILGNGDCLSEFQTSPGVDCLQLAPGESAIVRTLDDHQVYHISRHRMMESGKSYQFLLIELLTDEVRRLEREAYTHAIRTMAHEVNNTLTAIKATLTAMDETKMVRTCCERIDSVARFIRSYAEVVKVPDPQLQLTDYMELINNCRPLLESLCSRCGATVTFSLDEAAPLRLDPVLMQQALVNIVKNAAESAGNGGLVSITASGRQLIVADNGPGVDPQIADLLFSDCISTKPGGMGLGLLLTAEVLRKHKARFSLHTDADSITRFRMQL